MAKIVRYNGNLQAFASAAIGTERTLFGEVTQANDLTSQFTPDFLRGWGIVGSSDQPTLEDFNGAMYTNGQLSAYLHQIGVAEYNAAQEYHLGSLCNVAGTVYSSLINTNVGNTPASSPSQWRELYAAATETSRGSVELATSAETVTGSSTSLATHPAGVAAAIAAAVAAAQRLPLGYFSGFTLANNVPSPGSTINVSSGSARDSTNTVDINLASAFTAVLQVSGVWTAGTGQNKLDTGVRSASSCYHVFAIRKTSDGTGDILVSLSATAPTMPSGYSGFRLINFVRTDSGNNIIPFINSGDITLYKSPIKDVNVTALVSGVATYTLSLSTGVAVEAILYSEISGDQVAAYIASPDTVDLNPIGLGAAYVAGQSLQAGGGSALDITGQQLRTLTSATGSVRARFKTDAAATTGTVIVTAGWRIFR